MESMKMPLREIQRRYTKSEMAVMAWRSSETAYLMENRFQSARQPNGNREIALPMPSETPDNNDVDLQDLESRLGPIANRITNKQGEIDLRQLTGNEALHYMRTIGIPIAAQPGMTRQPAKS